MSSETLPLLPKEKFSIFEDLLEICTDLVFENYQIENFTDKKKAIIISYFLDKVIKEQKKKREIIKILMAKQHFYLINDDETDEIINKILSQVTEKEADKIINDD